MIGHTLALAYVGSFITYQADNCLGLVNSHN